ncbi:hypothetical protein KY285_011383 [Solanum tuberosum]|nr:hypothetical protein KY285_011383 [Solanum tuberosum]
MAESKRLTRGIQLNQQIASDFPSFNLFITQEIADNVEFAAKMREERRSEYKDRDCGIYMLAYAEWLSYGQGNPASKFDVMFLRSRYAALLWNYDQQKKDAGAISDSEAPPRHSRPQIVRDDSETIEIH